MNYRRLQIATPHYNPQSAIRNVQSFWNATVGEPRLAEERTWAMQQKRVQLLSGDEKRRRPGDDHSAFGVFVGPGL
jgi:hypothetical protein